MSAGLHHMSQAPSGSDPARSRMDPAVQAQATALKMLAARADHLRDRIGTLLQTVQQDPVGDRTRQSMYPWPTLLEWYQDVFRQVQDFSAFLRNPNLLSGNASNGMYQPNLLQTSYVLPSRDFGGGPDAMRLYMEGDPALRFAPEFNYSTHRLALFEYYVQELEAMHKDPISLGFVSDEEIQRLLHETERADRLPGIYRATSEAVEVVGERLAKARNVVKQLEGNFDWKLRLGEIYGSDSEEDEDGDEDGSGDNDVDDDDLAEEEVQVVVPAPSTSASTSTSVSVSTARPVSDSQSQVKPKIEGDDITIIPAPSQPKPQLQTRPQGTTSAAPIDLDLSDADDDDDEDDDMESVPIPDTTTSKAPSPSAHSSPLFGTEDGTGTAQGSPAGPGGSTRGTEDDDEDEDMEEVTA